MSGSVTLRGSPLVAAPGKIFLSGEYAVLEEGVAVLTAVPRYAVAQYIPGMQPTSPVVAEVDRRAREALGDLAAALPPGAARVDSAQLQQGGVKLGLGSSAAAAVAAAGAVFELGGVAIAGHEDLLFEVAEAGHRAAQGGVGSGADVAAAVYGGFLRFVRPRDAASAIVRLAPPPDLHAVVFWTAHAARTADLIRQVKAFAARDGAGHLALMDHLRAVGAEFARAFAAHETAAVIAAADAYGTGLANLGAAAGVPIVTPQVAEAAELARGFGGAAKPSGAGGGDVGIAFFAAAAQAQQFASRCSQGILVLHLQLGAQGAHRRLPAGFEALKKD